MPLIINGRAATGHSSPTNLQISATAYLDTTQIRTLDIEGINVQFELLTTALVVVPPTVTADEVLGEFDSNHKRNWHATANYGAVARGHYYVRFYQAGGLNYTPESRGADEQEVDDKDVAEFLVPVYVPSAPAT